MLCTPFACVCCERDRVGGSRKLARVAVRAPPSVSARRRGGVAACARKSASVRAIRPRHPPFVHAGRCTADVACAC
eukprot:1154828-Pleurochrysis_carterae.AAC.1